MRLGLLSYVNTLPLTYGLESGGVEFPGEVLRGEPVWLNEQVARGGLDVTAVSSVEAVAHPERYAILPGVCLYARGPVQSVRLFSRVPLEELTAASVTSASATSRMLMRVLCPTLQLETMREPGLSRRQPALLLIGDQALEGVAAPFVYDLSQLWFERTGLPMVFALWVAHRDFLRREPQGARIAREYLERSRRWGKEHGAQVLQEASRRTGLSVPRLESYFSVLHYRLVPQALEGLREFVRQAAGLGLLPGDRVNLHEEVPA